MLILLISLLVIACGGGSSGGGESAVLASTPPPQPQVKDDNEGWPECDHPDFPEPTSENAGITVLESSIPRMEPHVVHCSALDSTVANGNFHTARYQWRVCGPANWTPIVCEDPRPGLQEGDEIALDKDCEGFNFALLADVPGKFVVHLILTGEDGDVSIAEARVEIQPDTRTQLFVSGEGSDAGGDGSIDLPWRTPARAWSYIMANGKESFAISLERGYTYGGFANYRGSDSGAKNLLIDAYGSGEKPVLQWSAESYPEYALCQLANCENVLIRDVCMKGNDADGLSGVCFRIKGESTNIGLVNVDFGGVDHTDFPSYCVMTDAENPRDEVPERQSRGVAIYRGAGHSSAYFLFMDRPDTKGKVVDSSFAPNDRDFECEAKYLSKNAHAYVGMHAYVDAESPSRNLEREITSYYITADGNARFRVALPFPAALEAGNTIHIREICEVGDTDVFLFGCRNSATRGEGTEVRVRPMMAQRFTAIGTLLEGQAPVNQAKSAFRMLTSFVYLYRCSAKNSGVQAGVDIAADGIGKHRYQVYDRCFMSCLSGNNKVPINFESVEHVIVKACVIRGDFEPTTTGSMIRWLRQPNAGGDDVRLVHNTFYGKRERETFEVLGSYWADRFLTFENNLVARGFAAYFAIHQDKGSTTSQFATCSGNVYSPDQGKLDVFVIAGLYGDLMDFLDRPEVSGDSYGSISPDELESSDYLPDPAKHIVETTARTSTSIGTYQDYYGRDPNGHTWVGAVAGPVEAR